MVGVLAAQDPLTGGTGAAPPVWGGVAGEGARESAGERGLADAAWPREDEGVVEAASRQRVAKQPLDLLMAEDARKVRGGLHPRSLSVLARPDDTSVRPPMQGRGRESGHGVGDRGEVLEERGSPWAARLRAPSPP